MSNITDMNITTLRIQIVGENGVGKTALMKNAVEGSYDVFLKHSLKSDFMVLELKINNEKVIVQFWEQQASSYHSLIVMYDVSNRKSYEKALQILEFERISHPKLPILLLANKVDLENDRCVMEYEGELSAVQYGTLFNEVSCQDGQNLKESILELMKVLL